MYDLLGRFIIWWMGISISVPFVLEGETSGAKDFVSGECGKISGNLERAGDWAGEICVCNVECGDKCVYNSGRECVVVCYFGIPFGCREIVAFVEPDNFCFEWLSWGD